jgi:hypothetical protein
VATKLSKEEVLKHLSTNKAARTEAIKMLARDFPKEYLKLVKIDPKRINAPNMMVSDKEWQE